MNTAWAIERLEAWIALARLGIGGSGSESIDPRSAGYAKLEDREYQTQRVLMAALDLDHTPQLMRPSSVNEMVWLSGGLKLCRYAIGKLRTDDETRDKLGSTAPQMAADALHPLIWGAASGRWESGHYSDAVQRAATALSTYVKGETGRYDVLDGPLMQQTFSPSAPEPDKPRLWWPGDATDLGVKAMRNGIHLMAQGAFSAIRNTASHSTDEQPKQEAFEQLTILSILMRWIERCELVGA